MVETLLSITVLLEVIVRRTCEPPICPFHRYRIRCEPPNARLYVFDGAVVAKDDSSDVQPLTADNFLLRGCTLRKTDWVVGHAG